MKPDRNLLDDDDDSFGPGTDLIVSLLAILLIAIALGANIYQKKLDKAVSALDDAQIRAKLAERRTEVVEKRVELAESRVKDLKKQETPIINIPATSRYQFESKSAVLPLSLASALSNELAPQIDAIVREYQVDVVEVIGHTDGQQIERSSSNQSSSNLDSTLEKVTTENQDITTLTPGSNADLGLMRALSVIQVLQKNSKLKGLKFRAYSAAQLTLPDGNFAPANREPDPTRRRIEIRFTRLGAVKNIQ
ncbi:MAG: flagellar motor protein [Nostoc sp. SerVER01]|nr:flagellar motor protein [Nostoc sp. SerVER01]